MALCSARFVDAAGLAPEYVEFGTAGMVTAEKAKHNLLRPEAMEAMFVLWRVTQKEQYREWAWEMFLAFEKNCKVPTLSLKIHMPCPALSIRRLVLASFPLPSSFKHKRVKLLSNSHDDMGDFCARRCRWGMLG